MNPGSAAPHNNTSRIHRRGATLLLAVAISACTAEGVTPVESTLPPTTSIHSTTPLTTSVPTSTTTSTAPNPSSTTTTPTTCRPDPFAAPFPDVLSTRYPGKKITARVYDARSGCMYSLNPSNRQPTASVFKVMVMAGTLLEAQEDNREVSDWELSQLTPMITQSTNPQVRSLWSSFGSSPWFRQQTEIFELDETTVTADGGSAWGRTLTSASDQVDLMRQVLLGEWGPLEAEYRNEALALMTAVVPEQTWGVTAGVPPTWTVAQKNGFAGVTTNSVGWVDEPGTSNGYVVAILSTGWPNFTTGIPAVEFVSSSIADAMIDKVAGVE
ncbi:MAG TPA: serine hydrolase [Acidimicrobiia bacterium]